MVRVLVESWSWQLLRLLESHSISVKLLSHRVASRFVVRRAAETMSVFIGAGAGDIGSSVNVSEDLFNMLFLHVLAANAKRPRLTCSILMVVNA